MLKCSCVMLVIGCPAGASTAGGAIGARSLLTYLFYLVTGWLATLNILELLRCQNLQQEWLKQIGWTQTRGQH